MNDASRLQWGLMSTARISSDVIPGLQRSAKNQLAAVASRNRAAAEEFALNNGIERAFESYDEMLNDPTIDCVYIPLPNHLHAHWTRRAILAGKHVLCEKPFVFDPSEAHDLFTLAGTHGVHLAEAFMYRHHPKTHVLKQVVESGELGDIHTIRSWFSYAAEDTSGDIRFQPGMDGGALRDVGSYPVSMSNYLLDSEPESVSAHQVCDANGIDERFYGLLRYRDHVVATFDCSMRSQLGYGVTVIGSTGSATLASPWYSHIPPDNLEVSTADGTRQLTPDGLENAYFLETENFADVVANKAEPEVTAAETVRTMRTLARLHDAASAI
jgi:D-xylose 1-dehydrogenase (NADP+, D-xylono-1,5-lactone-forming)